MVKPTKNVILTICAAVFACVGLVAFAASTHTAGYPIETMQAAIDRLQIEDILIDYSWEAQDVKPGFNLDWFYTEDCVIEANGIVTRGRKALNDILKQMTEGGVNPGPRVIGKMVGVMSIPKIRVNGNTATSQTVWWAMTADSVKVEPRMLEMGREYNEWVKQDGRWKVKHRVLISDAGMPDLYDKTYVPQKAPF